MKMGSYEEEEIILWNGYDHFVLPLEDFTEE